MTRSRSSRLITTLWCLGIVGASLFGGLRPLTARAATTTYYFHGTATDDASRNAGTPTATFDTTAPTGTVPHTQTDTNDFFNPTGPADPNYAYWIGTAANGPVNGTLHIEWYWTTANAEAQVLGSPMDVLVYTDVDVVANTGTLIGRTDPTNPPVFSMGATPTLNKLDIAVSGTATTNLLIQAEPDTIDTGQFNTVVYDDTTAASFFSITSGGGPTPTPTPTATPTPPPPPPGSQVFHNYTAPYPYPHEPPPPTLVALLFGEPSIGVDWVTNNTMYQGDLNTWQVTLDYSVKPPTANWRDRSDVATDTGSLDARLIVDHSGGARGTNDRTVVDQLAAGQSAQAYSDTDGGTAAPPANSPDWIASSGGGFPSGPDHESTGAGRYHSGGTVPLPTPVYPHAIYYCAQSELVVPQPGPIDFCARSDNGGATYGQGVGTWQQSQCSGLHGKPRVGPNGTVYIPNKDCTASGGANAAKGLVVSTDNGATWTVHNIPNTTTDGNQPDSDVAVGGSTGVGTVYYGYRDGDHKAKVVVSNNEGNSWSAPIDVGAAFGIQNAQFPEVIAGDQDRAAVTFLGTTTAGDDLPDSFPAVWDLYVSFTYDGGQTWQTVDATPGDPVQRGGICMSGTGCSGSDRNMLDFNDETVDNKGRVQVAYTDGCSGACETNPNAASCSVGNQNCTGKFSSVFSMVSQVCGQGLFVTGDPGFFDDPSCQAAPIPEASMVTDIVGAGMVAAALVLVYQRRRRVRRAAA